MISGGVDPPRPSSHDSNGKGTNAKKRRYMVRLLPPRDSLTSSIPSPSSVSIPVRPPDVAPTPSPPPTEARPSSSHVNAHGPSPVPASTPSPSSVDACGPSPVPTSTPSPSPPMGNMSIDKDTVNLAMEDPPLNNCPMEEFEARLSQARSDAASSVGESQLTPLDPAEEQRLRSRCWVAVAGPKCKGRLYGTGDLAHTYNCGSDSFMQHTEGSSSHAEDATEINRLREELRQSKEDMHIFQSVLLQFLPPEARNIINQHQQPHQQHQDQHQDQADDQQVDDQQRHSPDDYFDY
ncbi:hypothetical protein JHK85_010200 [Glycine max]|nr:hypothetical protein JHK85_010200 [Glycine max]